MDTTRDRVIKLLDTLPQSHLGEVLDFMLFLQYRTRTEGQDSHHMEVKTVPANHLNRLRALVAWGGDALADTESLYEA
jgi:hypothetical protein